MEKRTKRASKTTTACGGCRKSSKTKMEASTKLGKTSRSKSAHKTSRARTTKACK